MTYEGDAGRASSGGDAEVPDEVVEAAQVDGEVTEDRRETRPGWLNRFVWDMRYPDARKVPGDKTTEEMTTGPTAPPGDYRLSLSVDGTEQTREFQIVKDPRVAASQADFDSQFDLHISIRDKLSETHDSINKLRSIRRQVEEWEQRGAGRPSADVISASAASLKEHLSAVEDELIQVGYKGARDRLHLPVKLNRKLAELIAVVSNADFDPPQQAYQVFEDLSSRIDTQLTSLQGTMDQEVERFTNLVHEMQIPAIVPNAGRPG